MSAELNQIDVDRLAHMWDLIHQTNTLCDAMRTLSTILKQDAAEITAKSMAKLEETISRKKLLGKKK